MLSKIWRLLLETINCFGSCAINSSVTRNPAALPITHKMDSLTSYKATTLGQYTKAVFGHCCLPSVFTESGMSSPNGGLY